jgi:hypothetical protein
MPVAENDLDCPHGPGTDFALSGSITNIPEYHDCQRFIDASGTVYMNGRMAIYVREGLSAVTEPTSGMPRESEILSLVRGDSTGVPAPVLEGVRSATEPIAVVWNLDHQAYLPLGITPDTTYYCLFLESGTKAKLVGVVDEADCNPSNPLVASRPGTSLKVNKHPTPGGQVPGTGRWAWDFEHKRQYIVIACPGGWCEIYPNAAVALVAERPGEAVSTLPSGHNFGPWIDVQPLALGGTVGLAPMPEVVGTGVPADDLDGKVVGDFLAGWTKVGSLYTTGDNDVYRAKFNLSKTSPGTLELCAWEGSGTSCLPDSLRIEGTTERLTGNPCAMEEGTSRYWAARIVQSKSIRYHCVNRTDHTGQAIPATLRWRWLADDETKWAKCAAGCCRLM